MGLLEELRTRAEEVESAKGIDKARAEAARAMAGEQLRPAMQRLYKYFQELFAHLETLAPDVRVGYVLDGFGSLGELRQGEYRIWKPNPDDVTQFSIGFSYRSKARLTCVLDDQVAARVLKDLKRHGIETKLENIRAGKAELAVIPVIPVSCEWRADARANQVTLTMRNFEAPGSVNYRYRSGELSTQWMEEFAKFILRKPSDFKTLSGAELDATERHRLRVELERQQRKRAAELGGPVSKLLYFITENVRKLCGRG